MPTEWLNALLGGALIGIAVSLMLYLNGRVTGVSGIINGLILREKDEWHWRAAFLFGLFAGGVFLHQLNPQYFANTLSVGFFEVAVAGGLVGFGTLLGSGCTSGHGVCGISRLSPRSIVATMVFIASGVLSVRLFQFLGVF